MAQLVQDYFSRDALAPFGGNFDRASAVMINATVRLSVPWRTSPNKEERD